MFEGRGAIRVALTEDVNVLPFYSLSLEGGPYRLWFNAVERHFVVDECEDERGDIPFTPPEFWSAWRCGPW